MYEAPPMPFLWAIISHRVNPYVEIAATVTSDNTVEPLLKDGRQCRHATNKASLHSSVHVCGANLVCIHTYVHVRICTYTYTHTCRMVEGTSLFCDIRLSGMGPKHLSSAILRSGGRVGAVMVIVVVGVAVGVATAPEPPATMVVLAVPRGVDWPWGVGLVPTDKDSGLP